MLNDSFVGSGQKIEFKDRPWGIKASSRGRCGGEDENEHDEDRNNEQREISPSRLRCGARVCARSSSTEGKGDEHRPCDYGSAV